MSSLCGRYCHNEGVEQSQYKQPNAVQGHATALQRFFLQYIDECRYSARMRSETLRGYKAVFDLFLRIMPEVTDIEDLNASILNEFFKRIETRQRMVGKILKTGVRQSTIKTQRSKLNVFFVWLCAKGYLEENPLKCIPVPKVRYDDFKRLKDHEINKIYAAIIQYDTPLLLLRRDIAIVSLLIHCGLRKGELLGLQVSDIDFDKKQITIRGETSKSAITRYLPLHPTLAMHLKDYLKAKRNYNLKTEYLIVTGKGDDRLTPHGLKHWTKRLEEKSGLDFHLHQFRHTFACKLVEADVNLFKIQKLMGHSDIKMTMKYARSLKTEDMAEDIHKISF